MNNIINCRKISENIKNEIKNKISFNVEKGFRRPKLLIILANNNPASKKYIKYKILACKFVGIEAELLDIGTEYDFNFLVNVLKKANTNNNIDGYILQFPIELKINKAKILSYINPSKDVDGLTSKNFGLSSYNDVEGINACTPKGIMYLLDYLKIDLCGKNVVIINSSKIVGRPLANLLITRKSTITICNKYTKNLAFYTKKADIIITATGCRNLIKQNMITKNVVIFDTGISHDDNGKICGDVDFKNVVSKCKYITSVPGGIGLMTISMLLDNLFILYKKNINSEKNKITI